MNDEQKQQYVDFMANFIHTLAEEHVPQVQAQKAALAAASCLCAVVFKLVPRDDDTEVEDFAGTIINVAISLFYGGKQVARAALLD